MSFFGLGLPELIIIGILALIFIGPERLPGVIRDVIGFYRQIRSLGTEWREQVEKEIGADLRDFTRDMNQGIEAFGRTIEREIQEVDNEIRDAQAAAMDSTPPPPAPAAEFPALPPVEATMAEEEEERRPLDYRPGG